MSEIYVVNLEGLEGIKTRQSHSNIFKLGINLRCYLIYDQVFGMIRQVFN